MAAHTLGKALPGGALLATNTISLPKAICPPCLHPSCHPRNTLFEPQMAAYTLGKALPGGGPLPLARIRIGDTASDGHPGCGATWSSTGSEAACQVLVRPEHAQRLPGKNYKKKSGM